MDAYEQMKSGKLYFSDTEELLALQAKQMEILYDYNATRPRDKECREALLKRLLAEVGDDCYIEPPLHANWGSNTPRQQRLCQFQPDACRRHGYFYR